MMWDDYMKYLTSMPNGSGKCVFAAIHGKDQGECWGRDPKEVPRVSSEEVKAILKAFHDPSVLYSSGIMLRGIKFIFLKIEGEALLGRKTEQACLVMKTVKAVIVCIYSGDEPTQKVYTNCLKICEQLKANNV